MLRIAARGAGSAVSVGLGGCTLRVLSGCGSVALKANRTLPIVSGRGVGRCLGSLYRLYRFGAPVAGGFCHTKGQIRRACPG